MRSTISLLLALVPLTPATTASLADLEACMTLEKPVERKRCLERETGDGNPPPRLIGELRRLLPERARPLVEWLDIVEPRALAADDAYRASLLDLRGSARLALGDHEAAATAMQRALALDDGTIRLTWFDPEGGSPRSRSVAAGNGRIARAAESLIAAGRIDEGKRLLARALALGATGNAEERWAELSGGPVEDRDPNPGVLAAGPWRALIPDIKVRLFQGEPIELAAQRGKVVILDFWASWCPPCLEELPHLERLYAAEKDNGLLAIAVNNNDPQDVALEYAEALSLTMPIGVYDVFAHRAFDVETVPTLIIADRNGRIRARWDGYRDGLERDLARLTRSLIAEKPEPVEEIADVLLGDGLLQVDWARAAGREIESIAVIDTEDGRKRLAVGLNRSVALFDETGTIVKTVGTPPFAGRLLAVDLDGQAGDELIGFRPGWPEVARLALDGAPHETWVMPSPVLDLVPWRDPEGGTVELLVGALDGLFRFSPDGKEAEKLGDLREVSALMPVGKGDDRTLLALEAGKRLHRLDRRLVVGTSHDAPPSSWVLVGTDGAAAAAPWEVRAFARGRFLPDQPPLMALGLASGELLILDPRGEKLHFRARWGSIQALGTVDFDGDGLDELVTAAGRTLAVLSARSQETSEEYGQ